MKKFLIKLIKKLLNRTLGIYYLNNGEKLIIKKSDIENVIIVTNKKIDNDKIHFQSMIKISTTYSNRALTIDRHHVFLNRKPDDSKILEVEEYNKHLKKMIMDPFHNYILNSNLVS